MGDKAKEIIAGELKKLNKEKKLRENHFTLYEKVCRRRGINGLRTLPIDKWQYYH